MHIVRFYFDRPGASPCIKIGTLIQLLNKCFLCVPASQSVRDGGWGTWDPCWMLGHGLDGSTVGIVGL